MATGYEDIRGRRGGRIKDSSRYFRPLALDATDAPQDSEAWLGHMEGKASLIYKQHR